MAMPISIIDAHQHFWNPERGEYGWLSGPYAPLRRVFTPDDLQPELVKASVGATVVVQTWASVEETRAFLALTQKVPYIAGVVGWLDLTAPYIREEIEALKAGPGGHRLVGIRHQVHDEPDENWLRRDVVLRGIEEVARAGLTYDLLLKPRELPAAFYAVHHLPQVRFVIDHIAKPDIRGGGFSLWAERMAPFADERSHVWCKLSGMVTEADWESWQPSDLKPYIDEVLRLFGPSRCMYGSDWPVCRVAGGYGRWLAALKQCIAPLPSEDQAQILARSAVEAYHLDLSDISL